MKNLLCSFLFITSNSIGYCQIPAPGNVLWLKADNGVYNDNIVTLAAVGDLVQVWEDQSGSGNHFRQDITGQRPQLYMLADVLCSKPVLRFDVGRATYLGSTMKMSGAKTIFIVFNSPSLTANPETLLSIKSNSNTYTEILCADNSAYNPLSYIAEVPASPTGGTMINAVGSNVSFSASGNIFTMTYDGGDVSSPSSYSAKYDASPSIVMPNGLFGRLPGDSTTIGARAPEQNYSFLSGDIAEIIAYNRVLSAAEINQVEGYLIVKYGFFSSCIVLRVAILDFTAKPKSNAVQLDWRVTDENDVKEYIVEHSTNIDRWDSAGARKSLATNNSYQEYQFIHTMPVHGINYYRLRIKNIDGKIDYSAVRKITFSNTQPAIFNIAPNPFKDYIYVQTEIKELLHITVSNSEGKLVKETNVFSNSPLDLKALTPGIYLIKVNGKNGETTGKILKQ